MGTNADSIGQAWSDYNENRVGLAYAQAGNVSFANEWLYSYDSPIARYMAGPSSEQYVLVSSGKHTRATSGQISQARVHITVPTFYVPILKVEHHNHHLDNVRSLWAILGRLGETAVREWGGTEGYWQGEFKKMWQHVELYVAFTGVKFQLTPLDIMVAAIQSDRSDRERAYYHPTALARRERAYARKLACQVLAIDPV